MNRVGTATTLEVSILLYRLTHVPIRKISIINLGLLAMRFAVDQVRFCAGSRERTSEPEPELKTDIGEPVLNGDNPGGKHTNLPTCTSAIFKTVGSIKSVRSVTIFQLERL